MRFAMRQKWVSWGDDFIVKDESGHQAYYIDGKVFTLRKTLLVLDPAGNEVAKIRKKILSLGTSYEVERDGRTAAVVRKHLFTLVRAKFTVDVPGPDDLEAAGNFTGHEYTFNRAGREVATVSKRWFRLSDTYGIEVAPGEDEVLIIASAVVIDMCLFEDHSEEKKSD